MVSSATMSASCAAWRNGTERVPERTKLSANAASPGGTPSFIAMASRSLTQAAYTPAVALLAPHWPPEPAETGKLESPSRTTTCAIGTPSISAAVWAMMV